MDGIIKAAELKVDVLREEKKEWLKKADEFNDKANKCRQSKNIENAKSAKAESDRCMDEAKKIQDDIDSWISEIDKIKK